MKIAIVGSRDYHDPSAVQACVSSLPPDTIVVSGGARGVDSWAERAARARGLAVEIHPANWDAYGKRAGFVRNYEIIKSADRVVAFWDGRSKGTAHSIRVARELGKELEIIY
jgi:hypothetical protein